MVQESVQADKGEAAWTSVRCRELHRKHSAASCVARVRTRGALVVHGYVEPARTRHPLAHSKLFMALLRWTLAATSMLARGEPGATRARQ